ncbi:MAG: hypothetical protein E6Q25_10100 [Acinetobacter sp.]|jgi:hypothetical protein|nr:MAG: hypothetical protein E6Q25_10100 [Acinetobacter sp.]
MKKTVFIVSAFITSMTLSTLVQAAPEHHQNGGDRSAMTKVCNGKKAGQAATMTMGGHSMQGTCELGFSPNHSASIPRGERGANNPTAQACQAKKVGQAVTVKVNGQNIAGKCELRFKGQRH